MWDTSNILKAVVVFLGYFVLCNFTSAGVPCPGAIMCLVMVIWPYMLSIQFSRSLGEMNDELGSIKNRFKIMDETLSRTVRELESANEVITGLKR